MADNPEASRQPEGADKPDWLESNFTSVEAQAQAYANARAEMGRAQAEANQMRDYAAQLEAEREQYAAELEAAQQPQPGYDQASLSNPLLLQLRQARENGDDQTELALTAYVASQIAEQKIAEALKSQPPPQQQDSQVTNEFYAYQADALARDQFDNKYGQGEWDAVKREAAQWLANDAPELVPDTLSASQAAQRLVWAAEYVQGRKMLAGTEEDRNQQAQARQRRLMAQTSTGSGTPPPNVETDQERWERLKNAPVSSYAELRSGQ